MRPYPITLEDVQEAAAAEAADRLKAGSIPPPGPVQFDPEKFAADEDDGE